jgi:hypothetical protein
MKEETVARGEGVTSAVQFILPLGDLPVCTSGRGQMFVLVVLVTLAFGVQNALKRFPVDPTAGKPIPVLMSTVSHTRAL